MTTNWHSMLVIKKPRTWFMPTTLVVQVEQQRSHVCPDNFWLNMTYNRDIWDGGSWFIYTLFRPSTRVKVIGQNSHEFTVTWWRECSFFSCECSRLIYKWSWETMQLWSSAWKWKRYTRTCWFECDVADVCVNRWSCRLKWWVGSVAAWMY